MARNGHCCPACGTGGVALWWAACHSCFRRMPSNLRRELIAAYRHRVSDSARWDEALVGVMQWRRHSISQGVADGGGGPE